MWKNKVYFKQFFFQGEKSMVKVLNMGKFVKVNREREA